MGGEVGVVSEFGCGSTFWVTLPLERGAPARNLQPPADLRGQRVLVVDDNHTAAAVLSDMLVAMGLEVDQAYSGLQALQMLRESMAQQRLYGLLLLDWHMPGMGGLELLQVLRQTHGTSMVIGFVTTESVKDRLDEAVRNGAAFVLPKPFTDAQLGDAVRAALSTHAAAKAVTAEAAHDGARPFGVGRITAIETALKKRIDPRLTLKEIDAVDFTRLNLPSFLAFFGLGDATAIRAFCLLDRPAFAMLEAFLAGSTVAMKIPNTRYCSEATELLRLRKQRPVMSEMAACWKRRVNW